MDSGPTLDVIDGFCDDDEDQDGEEMEEREREVWGRLFPLIDAYSKTGTWAERFYLYINVCQSVVDKEQLL